MYYVVYEWNDGASDGMRVRSAKTFEEAKEILATIRQNDFAFFPEYTIFENEKYKFDAGIVDDYRNNHITITIVKERN